MLWKVTALQLGSIIVDRSAMTHYKGKGEQLTVPIWGAAATDGKHKVVIDTGIRDIQEYRNFEPGADEKPEQRIDRALKIGRASCRERV